MPARSSTRVILTAYVSLIEQDNPFLASMSYSEFYESAIDSSLTGEGVLMRVIRDSSTGEVLGELDIHDTRKDEWEIGVKVFKAHWRRGVASSALPLFLAEVREAFGRDWLVARIAPDNEASVRLFRGVGAVPRGTEMSPILLDEGMVEKFRREHPELVNEFVREMGALFGVEPDWLLGRILVFDVPTSPAPAGGATGAGRQGAPNCADGPRLAAARVDLALRGVISRFEEIKAMGVSPEAAEEIDRSVERYKLGLSDGGRP